MELPNRSELESRVARRLSVLSSRQRREMERLAGFPPDITNVPDSFWRQVEEDYVSEVATLLLLLFAASADEHIAMAGESTQAYRRQVAVQGQAWAVDRARAVGSRYAASAKRYATAKLAPRAAATDVPAGVQTATGRAAAVAEPITRMDYQRTLVRTFGPNNDVRHAINHTTAAQTAGGDAGIQLTVGLSIFDRWRTNPGRLPGSMTLSRTGPCPICEPMDGRRRGFWREEDLGGGLTDYTRGPGPWIHDGCVCGVLYFNLKRG